MAESHISPALASQPARPVSHCRVCGQSFFDAPLLRYENMPKAAQWLPDEASLDQDRGVALEVCQCSGCGLVQLSGLPVPYYREVIRASAFSAGMKEFREQQFGQFVEDYSLKGKKVLEMGCGRGEYLSLMQQAGAEAYGIEYSEASVAHCVQNGLKVEQGFVGSPTTRLAQAPFEAFFILNFLEHLPEPNATLGGIRNNLAEGAVGLVEVPNFDMMLSQNLFSEFISDHLFYFTKETLETTLEFNGFEPLESKAIWHEYIISTVVRRVAGFGEVECEIRRPKPEGRKKSEIRNPKSETPSGVAPTDLTRFYEHQAGVTRQFQQFLSRYGERRVAVWGAGHQAFALLALTGLAHKIRYVVDSAPFKQGKYTPATHLRIVPPAMLESEPVDAVLVMAGGYSDEVARILQEKFGERMAVAISRPHGLEMA